jgi:hypothetical protein
LTRAEFFTRGIVAVDDASRRTFGVPFHRLESREARRFLREIAAGRHAHAEVALASWSKEIVDPLLLRASFMGSTYERHPGAVFWKVFVEV